jgi:hypothetical protein
VATGNDVPRTGRFAQGPAQHHDSLDRFTAVRFTHPDHAGLPDRGVADHQALDLGPPDLEAGRVDHALETVGPAEVAGIGVGDPVPDLFGAAHRIDRHHRIGALDGPVRDLALGSSA